MSESLEKEINSFLKHHPDVKAFDVLIPDLNGVLSPEGEFYAISEIWQVVMGVNSFLQSDLDRYRPRPHASI